MSALAPLRNQTKGLTLNDHILASLVLWALATDLIGQAIALMAEGLAALTQQISCHQLSLCAQGQSGAEDDAHSTYLEDLPSPTHSWCGHPHTLVKHMLNVVCLLNLG